MQRCLGALRLYRKAETLDPYSLVYCDTLGISWLTMSTVKRYSTSAWS